MSQKTNLLEITPLTVGQMAANCYLVRDRASGEMLIIDPGEDADYITGHITRLEGTPVGIIATHGHFDHILAAGALQMIYDIPFYMSREDTFLLRRMQDSARHFLGRNVSELPPGRVSAVGDDQSLKVGSGKLTVYRTAGHTPGSICLYDKNAGAIFTGDTIFAGGGVGRVDFSYSDRQKLTASLSFILALPGSTVLYPGHGATSTVEAEKIHHVI